MCPWEAQFIRQLLERCCWTHIQLEDNKVQDKENETHDAKAVEDHDQTEQEEESQQGMKNRDLMKQYIGIKKK